MTGINFICKDDKEARRHTICFI